MVAKIAEINVVGVGKTAAEAKADAQRLAREAYDKIVQDMYDAANRMDDLYDQETGGSVNTKMQKIWERQKYPEIKAALEKGVLPKTP